MPSLDASTPQLKALHRFIDAYGTLDMDNVKPLLSTDFHFQTFPEIANLPKEAKEKHIERYRELLAGVKNFEVGTRY
jgi:hypothetical protein